MYIQPSSTLIRVNPEELASYAERSDAIGAKVEDAHAMALEMFRLAPNYQGQAEDDLMVYIPHLIEHMICLYELNAVRGRFLRQTTETMQNCDHQLANDTERFFRSAGGIGGRI